MWPDRWSGGETTLRRWVLLEGNRHVVATLLLACIFALLVVLGRTGVIDVGDPDAVRGIAGGLVPGLFTFLSIVLAINQLVLTQEFGSADEIRERVRELRGFRADVESHAATIPSPVLPTAFLAVLTRATGAAATALVESLPADADREVRQAVADYAATVTAETSHVTDVLQRSESGRIHAILSVLEYPDARQLHEARRLRHDFAADLCPDSRAALDDLLDLLELFSVARTHFRTTYTQRVLARLSRLLLYVGVPALVAALLLHLVYPLSSSSILGRYRLLVVPALLTVALAPIAVLFAYILRIATVSERTIAVGPFLSRPGSGSTAADSVARGGTGDGSGPARQSVGTDDPPDE